MEEKMSLAESQKLQQALENLSRKVVRLATVGDGTKEGIIVNGCGGTIADVRASFKRTLAAIKPAPRIEVW